MRPDHWSQLEAAIKEILRTSGDEDSPLLARLEATNPNLLAAAHRFVANEDTLKWESSPLLEAQSTIPRPITVGTKLGQYEIVELLGHGGMGAVYLAEQDNPRRQVALKIIATDFLTDEPRRRFTDEIEMLARLSHPGIAQIFEAGETDGPHPRPYFTMEHVEGPTLDRFVELNSPSRADRVQLLIRLCDAVQHAHMRGILHRDLKPTNVLVDASGRPKLLDFGVARLLDAAESDRTRLQTQPGHIVGTLAYMSPEQAAADPVAVDVRTDVYALGVIGYELLSGNLPHQLANLPIQRAIEQLQTREAIPLHQVNRSIDLDLSIVISKALAPDLERRYSSPLELAQDLDRVLRGDAIEARRTSTVYKVGKLARRHRAVLVFLLLATAGFLTGVVGLVAQYREVQRRNLLLEFYATDKLSSESKREYFEDQRLDDLTDEIETRFADNAKMRLELFELAARRANDLGLHRQAADLLGKAEAISQSIHGALASQTMFLIRFRAETLVRSGQPEEAERLVRPYLEQIEAGGFDPREDNQPGETLFRMRFCIADVSYTQGRHEEAASLYQSALAVCSLPENHPDPPNVRSSLAAALVVLGRFEEAEPTAWSAYLTHRRWQGLSNPATISALRLATWCNIASNQFDLAESRWQQLDDIVDRIHGRESMNYALTQLMRAELWQRQGQLVEAKQLYRTYAENVKDNLADRHWFEGDLSTMEKRWSSQSD